MISLAASPREDRPVHGVQGLRRGGRGGARRHLCGRLALEQVEEGDEQVGGGDDDQVEGEDDEQVGKGDDEQVGGGDDEQVGGGGDDEQVGGEDGGDEQAIAD